MLDDDLAEIMADIGQRVTLILGKERREITIPCAPADVSTADAALREGIMDSITSEIAVDAADLDGLAVSYGDFAVLNGTRFKIASVRNTPGDRQVNISLSTV